MRQQLLLLDDVEGLGRSGDIVTAKAGYIRNFLLPQKKGVLANRQTLKMQARLKEERAKQAARDRQTAEEITARLAGVVLTTKVRVDHEGHLYGSVTSLDVARLLQENGYAVEKRQVGLLHPIKQLGQHVIELRLKEGVVAHCTLDVVPSED